LRQAVEGLGREGFPARWSRFFRERIARYWPAKPELQGRALWLTWQTGWLFLAQSSAGVFNYLSNVAAGRLLGPADYGAFAALSAVLVILVALAGTIQTLTAQGVARALADGQGGQVAALLRYLFLTLALRWGGLAALAAVILSPLLASWLHTSAIASAVAGITILPLAMLPVFQGALRGSQRFIPFGATVMVNGGLRFVLTVLLALLGLGLAGTVAALPLSYLAAALLGLWLLRDLLRREPNAPTPLPIRVNRELIGAALGLLAFAFLVNADVILVKNRFPAEEAGLYSAMAVLGKAVLYFPAAVTGVLLPLVVGRTVRGERSLSLLLVSLGAVLALCAVFAVPFALFPVQALELLFGDAYAEHASLLGSYSIAMMLYAMANVWLIYAIGRQRPGYPLLLGVVALAEMVALAVVPPELEIVVMVVVAGGAVAIALAVVEGARLRWSRRISANN
jgi:O-antigen/teichoic acid export membrane protein